MGLSIKNIVKKATTAVQSAASNVGHTLGEATHSVASATTHVAQQAGAAIKTGATNVAQTTKAAVKSTADAAKVVAAKTVTAVKNVQKKGAVIATLALFAPMVPLAIIFLKRRNVKPSSDLGTLVSQVHNERLKGSFGMVNNGDVFDSVQSFGLADVLPSGVGIGGGNGPIAGPTQDPSVIASVISYLKDLFNQIIKKKASGEPLSADEKAVADAAPQIQEAINDAKTTAQDTVNQTNNQAADIANSGKSEILDGGFNWKIAAAAILLIVLFIWFKKR